MKKRSSSKQIQSSANVSYEVLEDRNLLAADSFASNYQFAESTGLIRTLAEPVAMQERFDVLREVVDVAPEDTFVRTSLNRDALGFAHLKHQQYHAGVPIEGATFTVHIKDQQVVSVSGSFQDYDAVDSNDVLGEEAGLQAALDFVDADLYMWESLQHDHSSHDHLCTCCDCLAAQGNQHIGHSAHDHGVYSDQAPTGELIYLPTADGNLELTWMFDVYAVEPLSRQHIFVDASSGSILETHNQIHHADVDADGTSLYDGTVDFIADDTGSEFRLRQETNGVETYDLNNGTSYNAATDVISGSTSFTAGDVQTGVQAHFGAEQTLQYFLEEHGRDSYDGNGAILRSYVSYSTNYVNAFWDGSRMTYGDGNGTSYGPLVSLDIVGHEVAHGVTGNSAGLIYQNESGALNESFSDIFGESIENFALGSNDWLMGDDIGIGGSGALRSMSNPNQFGDPDTYFGDSWYTGTGDNGGVHINSGVQNKWFYILSEGESGTNDNGDAYDIAGIGIQEAGDIAYRNLTVYLNQSSTYAEAREGAVQSAIDLFGFDSPQHLATAAAWDAVGVYAPEPPTFSFASVNSLGAGVYRGNVADTISNGETLTIPIDIDAGQKLSVSVVGSNGLTPAIELRDPSGNLIGSNSGSTAMLQDVLISESGTFEFSISGDAGSSGDFEATSLLNSSFEAEMLTGISNNTLAEAENLETSSVSFGPDASIDRLVVTAQLESASPVFAESFESGSLGSDWTTSSSTNVGRIRVTDGFNAAEGSYTLLMDVSQTSNYNVNEAILSVDLDPADAPILQFSRAEWSDENDQLPDTFSGSFDGDGVSISADGVNWFTVLTGTNNDDAGSYTTHSFDLATIANEVGITLGNDFQIKFQQYDNWTATDDGIAYDNILIVPQQSAPDIFQFELEANEIATISTSTVLGGGEISVSLLDTEGTVLETGIAADNFSSVIAGFSDETGGTFYARVDGSLGTQYNLVVTRGAALDVEPNDAANPLAIDDYIGVFGHVSSFSTGTSDPDAAENGARIDGFFEGVTLSNPVDGGGIYAPFANFGAPTGDLVFGPTSTSSDGFREFETEFQADFNSLQSTVSIDVGSDDGSDVGFLRAYDLQGNLLEEVVSNALSTGQSQTLTITRGTAEIAFVIAAGVGTDITPLDNLVFSSIEADSDFYTIDLDVGEVLQIDAYLPGAGPHLFDNGLDQSTSELRVEVTDPSGALVAAHSEQIEYTATDSGTFTIKVYANDNEGEYVLNHGVIEAEFIEVNNLTFGQDNDNSIVNNLTVDFSHIVNPEAGAFSLIQRETGDAVDLAWTIDNSAGYSQLTFTFSGSLTEASGSLVDGNYQFSIDGSLLGGVVAGSDFVYGDQESDNFYRYYGDTDGNRLVNVVDLLGFRRTYLLSDGDSNFDARFDGNGDGNVDVFDLLKFRNNYNKPLLWT
jgi:Zn-dependent metalloprotease